MKKLEIEKNFHDPRLVCRGITYKSLFDHNEVVEAFIWDSVGLNYFFEDYYMNNTNEKEAKKGTLKVLACAPE